MSSTVTMFDLAGEKLSVNVEKYRGGDRTAIRLIDEDGCPYMQVTSLLSDEIYDDEETLEKIVSGEWFAVKNYAENSGIFEALCAAGIIEGVGITVHGHYDTAWPIARLVTESPSAVD